MADFILNLSGCLFGNTIAFPVGIVRHLARLFPDLALYFVNLACDFILNAGFIWLTPVPSIEARPPRRRDGGLPSSVGWLFEVQSGREDHP